MEVFRLMVRSAGVKEEGDGTCASSLSAGTNVEKGLSITLLCKAIQEAACSSSLCVSQGGVGEAGVCLLDSEPAVWGSK